MSAKFDELIDDLDGEITESLSEPVFSDVTGDDSQTLEFRLRVTNPQALIDFVYPAGDVNEDTPEDELPSASDVIDLFIDKYEYDAPVSEYGLTVM